MRICKLDSRNLGQGSMMECFKNDADPQAFHNYEKFLDKLSTSQLLNTQAYFVTCTCLAKYGKVTV